MNKLERAASAAERSNSPSLRGFIDRIERADSENSDAVQKAKALIDTMKRQR